MIRHYLKVAWRNLLAYKAQSLISAVCLAIGIVCFSYVFCLLEVIMPTDNRPMLEQRVTLVPLMEHYGRTSISPDELQRVEEELGRLGVTGLSAHSYGLNGKTEAEIEILNEEGQMTPFLVRCQAANATFFAYEDMDVQGLPEELGPQDVVLAAPFARKAFGDESPIGKTLRFAGDGEDSRQMYRVAGVATGGNRDFDADCYFALDCLRPAAPSLLLSCFMPRQMDRKAFGQALEKITWQRGDKEVSLTGKADTDNRELGKTLIMLLVSLILVSGLINFLKFVIQMFFNRQRELALRKCLGSDNRGLYKILASEVFLMLTLALLLSLPLTEWLYVLLIGNLSSDVLPDVPMGRVYGTQIWVYAVTLAVSLLVICYPIGRLRQVSLYTTLQSSRKKHRFRNVMIGLQLAVSTFFIGGVAVVGMIWDEMFLEKRYQPLSSEEEERIAMLTLDTHRVRENIAPILAGMRKMPEVEDVTYVSYTFDMKRSVFTTYKRKDGVGMSVLMSGGDPGYFRFYGIPMQGKELPPEASGQIYISKQFKQCLDEEGNTGSVTLDGTDYQIAGVYEALYGEINGMNAYAGSVFLPSTEASSYYIKVNGQADMNEVMGRMEKLCREFVPETLPLSLHYLTDADSSLSVFSVLRMALAGMAVISLLLVALSIYSSISLDSIGRRKEVAIRKINGATPTDIVILFAKAYIILLIVAFVCVYPLVFLMADTVMESMADSVYSWQWPLLTFFAITAMLFVVTGYKIWQVMRLNPAEVVKSE